MFKEIHKEIGFHQYLIVQAIDIGICVVVSHQVAYPVDYWSITLIICNHLRNRFLNHGF